MRIEISLELYQLWPNQVGGFVFFITMAIWMQNIIQIYILLIELFYKWYSSYQKWKKRTKITQKVLHLWSKTAIGIVY